jgi:hypothetical protein
MNDRSDASPVYHGPGPLTRLAARLRGRPDPLSVPRVFALVRDDETPGLVAWGMALPDGGAVTIGGSAVGSYSSPARAARLHHAELEWM